MLALCEAMEKPYFGDKPAVRTVLPARNDSLPHQTAQGSRAERFLRSIGPTPGLATPRVPEL